MYNCKICGNKKYFNELNNIKTFVVIGEDREPIGNLSSDEFLSCVEVYCDVCHASSEDGDILNDKGIVINFQNQDPPDIGY